MKKFTLKAGNDVLSSYIGTSIGDAIEYFSVIKNLSSKDLLSIYKVVES